MLSLPRTLAVLAVITVSARRAGAQAGGDGYDMTIRQTMQSTGRIGVVTGEPRTVDTRVRILDGRLRIDARSDAIPSLRPGSFVLMDAAAGRMQMVDTAAREVMVVDGAAMRTLFGATSMTVRDTSSSREDLGPGETILGYPTRKYRVTIRYAVESNGSADVYVTYLTTGTLQMSEQVAALDAGFGSFGRRLLDGNGVPIADASSATLAALAKAMPAGFALQGDMETRLSIRSHEESTRSEWRVLSLARGGVHAADVTAPVGYTIVDMNAMLQQSLDEMKAGLQPSAPVRKP